MLDCSVNKIRQYREKYDFDFWRLRTPLTQYAIDDIPYGLDNGCFSKFYAERWAKQIEEAETKRPIFVCLPDIVEDARRTLELFKYFWHKTGGLPRCLVLQDGIGSHEIPWNDLEAVFIGGSDSFKISTEAMNAAKCAKMLGKWVHVGRVNTIDRLNNWKELADSIDGSGISQYDHMLENLVSFIKNEHNLDKQDSLPLT